MKKINVLFFILCVLTDLISFQVAYSQSNTELPFKKIKGIPETFEQLPFSSIKPEGWLKKEIEKSLDGFTGHLDSLVPSLIIKDDIYNKDRLTKHVKSKDIGAWLMMETGRYSFFGGTVKCKVTGGTAISGALFLLITNNTC